MILAGFIELIAKIKQKNNGTFKLVDAQDVECDDGKGLDEVLNEKLDENQGVENANKVLGIGADGNVTPVEMSGGVKDYNDLENKPSINGVELKGQLTSEDLGIIAKADNILKGEIKKSSNPSVDDSFKREFWNLKMCGKSTQVKTTGYQLLDASKLSTKSQGGVTITNNGDGSFTVSGSGELTSAFNVYYTLTNAETIELFKEGLIKLIPNGTTYPRLYVKINNSSGVTIKTLSDNGSLQAQITEQELLEGAYLFVQIYGAASGGAIVPGIIKPMLYQDGDGTWEPYSGGKPSPNPDYKQDITTIDKFEGNVVNENLLDISNFQDRVSLGITLSKTNDNGIRLSGTASQNVVVIIIDEMFISKGTYTINEFGATNYRIFVRSKTDTSKVYGNSINQTTFTVENDDIIYIYFSFDSQAVVNTVCYPQLTKGSQQTVFIHHQSQLISYTPTQKMYSTLDGSICDYVDVQKGVEVYNMATSNDFVFDYKGTDEVVGTPSRFRYRYRANIKTIYCSYAFLCTFCEKWDGNNIKDVSWVILGSGDIYFYFMQETGINTLQKAQNWLAELRRTQETLFVYLAPTPTEIPIDEEQLAILRKLYSYEGVTNFLCNGEVSCNYEISQQINNEKMWQAINVNKLNITTM